MARTKINGTAIETMRMIKTMSSGPSSSSSSSGNLVDSSPGILKASNGDDRNQKSEKSISNTGNLYRSRVKELSPTKKNEWPAVELEIVLGLSSLTVYGVEITIMFIPFVSVFYRKLGQHKKQLGVEGHFVFFTL